MNERYAYMAAVKADVLDYIEEEINLTEWKGRAEELEEYLNNVLWVCYRLDENASGAYFFNPRKAEKALINDRDLLSSALAKFVQSGTYTLRKGTEAMDSIRRYVLNHAVSEVLNELSEEIEEEDETE